MLFPTRGQLNEEPRADPGGPEHKDGPHDKDHDAAMGHEEGHCGEDHHGEHAVANKAEAAVEIKVAVAAGEHVEDDVEEEGGDGDPAEDDTEVELAGE